MIVVDASIFIELVLWGEKASGAQQHLSRDSEWLAAEHVDLEVTNALRKMLASKTLTLGRAQKALEDFRDFRIVRFAAEPLVPLIWSLRNTMTPYDAAYVAIAKTFATPFMTSDARLHAACNKIVSTFLI